ncbi:MAG: class I tRNA ligase family protein, partial [Bacillota bacterium]|nr:class I tRNA ligase family protein [Bacillota bacterium]
HSGGKDLIFPHHENEIAQSEAANGQTFARYWLHNGFINVNNEKMSKSLGNFFTIRDIAKKYDYEVIRFFMLSAHYRSPINFSEELMEQSKTSLERLYTCAKQLDFLISKAEEKEETNEEKALYEKITSYRQKFIDAMDDDINTADAISVLFEIVKEINTEFIGDKTYGKKLLCDVKNFLKDMGGVLGILQNDKQEEINPEIKALIDARALARKEKNWAEADRIRDELLEKGIELKDTPQGVQIKITGKQEA